MSIHISMCVGIGLGTWMPLAHLQQLCAHDWEAVGDGDLRRLQDGQQALRLLLQPVSDGTGVGQRQLTRLLQHAHLFTHTHTYQYVLVHRPCAVEPLLVCILSVARACD